MREVALLIIYAVQYLPVDRLLCPRRSSNGYKAICWNRLEMRELVSRFQPMMKRTARADRKDISRLPSLATTLSA